MATPIIMPRQGQSVESCIISKWFKKKGERVVTGDVLFSYETDKAAFEEEAQVEGILLEIYFSEGEDVPVLTNVCVIGEEGEETAAFAPEGLAGSQDSEGTEKIAEVMDTNQAQMPSERLETGSGSEPVAARPFLGEMKISPRARRAAMRAGVDERLAVPSGPEGRVIERDIVALIEKGPKITPAATEAYRASEGSDFQGTGIGGRITTHDLSAPKEAPVAPAGIEPVREAAAGRALEYTEVKLTNIRKVIAKAMHHSLSTTAQLTLHASFDATAILDYRKALKAGKDTMGLANITLNDIVLYAVSRTLLQHKDLNAHFLEDKMHVYHSVHLGLAVDTDRGLMVPTLRHADGLSLNQMAGEVKALAKACQESSISPDLLKGGTFTVTNLGALEIESFTPVLNPPQTGILGVNTIVYRQKEVDGNFITYPAMGLSLTFDHRAVDGAPAARFLKDLKGNLENFMVLLAK